jgi:hypothetical protein
MRGLIYPVVFLIAAIVIGVGFLILRPQSLWAPASRDALRDYREGTWKTGPYQVHLPSQSRSRKVARLASTASPVSQRIRDRHRYSFACQPRPTFRGTEIINGMTKSAVLASFAAPTQRLAEPM